MLKTRLKKEGRKAPAASLNKAGAALRRLLTGQARGLGSERGRERGFSLIELLVVVALLAILSAVAIPSYIKYKNSSYEAWVVSELAIVAKHLEMARQVDGHYHQFIGHTGYVPRGQMYGNLSFNTANTAICCGKYPNPAFSSSATASKFHKFSYLRKASSGENMKHQMNARQICRLNTDKCSETGDSIVIKTFGEMGVLNPGAAPGYCSFKDNSGGARLDSTCDCGTYLLVGGTRYKGKKKSSPPLTGQQKWLSVGDSASVFAIDNSGQLCKVPSGDASFKPHY